MSINLRIRPDAATFAQKALFEASEESVLVIFGVMRGAHQRWVADKPPLLEELLDAGKELIASLPSTLTVDYEIGINKLSRVPSEDIYVIDGVRIYLPPHLLAVLDKRQIVLDDGALTFEPGIEPYEVQLTKEKPVV